MLVAPADYPGKRYRERYAYEHHIVWWKHKGFVPDKGMEIHHKDNNHRNNKFQNLQLVTSQEHRKIHGQQKAAQAEKIKFECPVCEQEVLMRMRLYKDRKRKSASGKVYCSPSCAISSAQKEKWKSNRLKLNCCLCGISFERMKSLSRNKNEYCSRKCYLSKFLSVGL
jgi:transcription elongation factor Elf1